MPLIRTITGTETFSNGSAKLLVSLMPSTAFPIPGADKFGVWIDKAAKNQNYITAVQRAAYLPSSTTGVKEQGNFWDANYSAPEGMIFRVAGVRRIRAAAANRASIGRVTEDSSCVVFIRMRETGPLQRLQLKRVEHHQSTNAPVYIEGRFDILSLREVGAAGVVIQSTDLTMSRPGSVQAVLTHTEVAPAARTADKAKVEIVTSHDGEAVAVTTTRNKRAMRL